MDQPKFEALLTLIVPQVVQLICEHYGWDETTAADKIYSSKVYASLEREETKVWHFSPLTLFSMFEEEQRLGTFDFPEEA